MNEFGPKPGIETHFPMEPHERRTTDRLATKKTARSRILGSPERLERERPLNDREKAFLIGYARGKLLEEINVDLDLQEGEDESLLTGIHEAKHSDSVLSAVLITIDGGEIVPQDVLRGIDRKKYRTLDTTDREILAKLTANQGIGYSETNAARELGIDEASYRTRLDIARTKLDARTEEQIAALFSVEYVPTGDEQTLFTLVAQGFSRQEIAERFGKAPTTIDDDILKCNQKYGTKYTLETLLKLMDSGVIPLDRVLLGYDRRKFQNLNEYDTRVLDAYIDSLGEDRSDLEIGNKLGLTRGYIRQRMTRIYRKLETTGKEDTVAKYFAYKNTQDVTEVGETDSSDDALLLMKARGLSNQEIGNKLGNTELTIKDRLTDIYDSLEAGTATQAVVEAVRKKRIDVTAVLEGRAISLLELLTEEETQVLDVMILEGSKGRNQDILQSTPFGNSKINSLLRSVTSKFNAKNRFQVAALYTALKSAQQELQR